MIHGEAHANAVYMNGMSLAGFTKGAARDVIADFAFLHDKFRLNDDDDPEHGLRAAAYARATVMSSDIERLCYALEFHDKGFTSLDPTVGCCWDADRLELVRVGITPDPKFMSTHEGKRRAADLYRTESQVCWTSSGSRRSARRRDVARVV